MSTSAAFQYVASSSVAIPDTRLAAQPTRSASMPADSTAPVFSTTPARNRLRAQAVRAVSPRPSGSFRLTGAPFPDVMLSSDQRHLREKVTHSIWVLTCDADTGHVT